MNVNCNIIRDLLPLYAEGMASEESKALVDDHLRGCDSCTKELAELKKAPRIPAEVETTSLRRVENAIRRRKLLTAATAMLTLAAVLVTGFIFLLTPVYLTAQQAIEGVELREDGALAIDYTSGIMGYGSTSLGSEDDEFFWCHTTRYDWLRSKLVGPDLSGMTQEELERYVQNNALKGESFQVAWDRILNIHLEYGTWKTPKGSYFPNNLTGDWELVSRTADKNEDSPFSTDVLPHGKRAFAFSSGNHDGEISGTAASSGNQAGKRPVLRAGQPRAAGRVCGIYPAL